MKIIEAYECTCDKCGYVWSSINYPVTCANKPCRSPRWNKPRIGSLAAPQEDLVPRAVEMTNKNLPEVTPYNRFEMYNKVQTKLDPDYQPKKMQTIEELRNMIASKQPHESVLPEPKVETDDVTIDYGEI